MNFGQKKLNILSDSETVNFWKTSQKSYQKTNHCHSKFEETQNIPI